MDTVTVSKVRSRTVTTDNETSWFYEAQLSTNSSLRRSSRLSVGPSFNFYPSARMMNGVTTSTDRIVQEWTKAQQTRRITLGQQQPT